MAVVSAEGGACQIAEMNVAAVVAVVVAYPSGWSTHHHQFGDSGLSLEEACAPSADAVT